MRPCGRARCSWECRDLWANKLASVLKLSFQTLPPSHHLRVTPATEWHYGRRRDLLAGLTRGLHRRSIEYCRVNEWSQGVHHWHLLLRVPPGVEEKGVRKLVRRVLGQVNYSLEPVRDPAALANYIVKNLKDDETKEMPPEDWRGRLYQPSKGFLAANSRVLWRRCYAEWY
jgi:hypothetical protein